MKKTMKSFVSIVLALALVASIGIMALATTVEYYTVKFELSNGLERVRGSDVTNGGANYNAQIGVRSSYKSTHELPDTIEITVNGDILLVDTNYTYNSATGEITILAASIPTLIGTFEAVPIIITAVGVGERGGNGDDLPPADDPVKEQPVKKPAPPPATLPEVIPNPSTGARA